MRTAAKRDSTEGEIVRALEADGWVVSRVSDAGVLDLLLSRGGLWLVMECKSPGGKPTPRQEAFIAKHGASALCPVVSDPLEAVAVARFYADSIHKNCCPF